MKKINTTPLSGMQELLPKDQALFDYIKANIINTFHAHAFNIIETPVIERLEVLLAKSGGDISSEIYQVAKTGQDLTKIDEALRFDHTVPLSRYVVNHAHELTFPFRVSQIGRNYRGERAQKGRFREFYQCDCDIIGRDILSLDYDAEAIATLAKTLASLGLPKLIVRVSNRKILTGLVDSLNAGALNDQIFSIVDHAEKVTPEATLSALAELGLNDHQVALISQFIELVGPRSDVVNQLQTMNISQPSFQEGAAELNTVLSRLESLDLPDVTFRADLKIVRGLNYYTGTVFETILEDYKQLGSICSGGRYENLTGAFIDRPYPGVGGSIGLTRVFTVLGEAGLLDQIRQNATQIITLIPLSDQEYLPTQTLAAQLRTHGYIVDLLFTDKKLGDKLSYASKTADFAIIIGEAESTTGNYQIKNLATGATLTLTDFLSQAQN